MNEKISIKEKISIWKESDYLIISNRKRCDELLNNSSLDDNDIIDILISLYIILEVGLNTLFRHLLVPTIEKEMNIDKFKIIKNLDNINFIDKTTLFIYNSKFDFGSKIKEVEKYHSIIDVMKDFSKVRNRLLHGHSISTIFDGQKNYKSDLKKDIHPKKLNEQILKFIFICEGLKFYLDSLISSFTKEAKEDFKKNYLDVNFLPILRT